MMSTHCHSDDSTNGISVLHQHAAANDLVTALGNENGCRRIGFGEVLQIRIETGIVLAPSLSDALDDERSNRRVLAWVRGQDYDFAVRFFLQVNLAQFLFN